MPAPDAKSDTKRFFKAESSEASTSKPFAKTRTQLSLEEKPKILSFMKSSKSDNEMNQKTESCEEKPMVFKEEQVQIIEKRQMYNDYKAEILGYLLLIGIFVFFTWLGVVFLLRMMDLRTKNVVFDLAAEDVYYCMLVPLILPITMFAVYGNWVAMKFFRHS